jgi:hypothetical protein
VKATFDAVKRWQYRPATYHGVPVAVVTIIDVNFSLGNGEPPPSGEGSTLVGSQPSAPARKRLVA